MRVEVRPELFQWAIDRAGLTAAAVLRRLPALEAWESGERQPTLKQLEAFARLTHAPVGYFFLPEPPVERVPVPDFRTVADTPVGRPSPDLLDTLYLCQQRQEWFREFARAEGQDPVSIVGAARITDDAVTTAARMREALQFDLAARREAPTWEDALRAFIGQADALGVLVMVNGVVGNNNRRKLRPDEFRGFALSDALAPLVFVNGADTKSAQMFTLAHELAHIWLGESALSDVGPDVIPAHRVERWCNEVAAEFLVPLASVRAEYRPTVELHDETRRLARVFKVSTLVVLRRLADAGALTREEMWTAYMEEVARLKARASAGGGDFYLTQAARVGKRFARALVSSTLEGRTLYTEAFQLLGFSKLATFQELGKSLGVS
ncbi:MAG: ImmA/IrrE family metallo-endopeptidase [Vicinamibacterales bacterium]